MTTVEESMRRLTDIVAFNIADVNVKNGVYKILTKYENELAWMPTSTSGKYHKHEPMLVDHILNCMYFADMIAKEFKIKGLERDIFFAGIILHDIGRVKTTFNGKIHGSAISKSGDYWCDREFDHALWGGMIVRSADFMCCEQIAELVESHMSHWNRRNPQPVSFLQKMVALSDYLASYVVVKE